MPVPAVLHQLIPDDQPWFDDDGWVTGVGQARFFYLMGLRGAVARLRVHNISDAWSVLNGGSGRDTVLADIPEGWKYAYSAGCFAPGQVAENQVRKAMDQKPMRLDKIAIALTTVVNSVCRDDESRDRLFENVRLFPAVFAITNFTALARNLGETPAKVFGLLDDDLKNGIRAALGGCPHLQPVNAQNLVLDVLGGHTVTYPTAVAISECLGRWQNAVQGQQLGGGVFMIRSRSGFRTPSKHELLR